MAPGIAELCQPYKDVQLPGVGASLIAGRPEAVKLLGAFALAPLPPWHRPRTRIPDDHRDRWVWLWSGFAGGPSEPHFLDVLARLAGINAEAAYRVWPSLMISRLVFPDGTVGDEASRIALANVARAMQPRGPGRPPNPKKEDPK